MRISDWSSDVCSSDLIPLHPAHTTAKPDAIATRPKPINPSLLSPIAPRPHHQPAIPDPPRNQPIPPTTPTASDNQPANATTTPITKQRRKASELVFFCRPFEEASPKSGRPRISWPIRHRQNTTRVEQECVSTYR